MGVPLFGPKKLNPQGGNMILEGVLYLGRLHYLEKGFTSFNTHKESMARAGQNKRRSPETTALKKRNPVTYLQSIPRFRLAPHQHVPLSVSVTTLQAQGCYERGFDNSGLIELGRRLGLQFTCTVYYVTTFEGGGSGGPKGVEGGK